MKYLLLLTVVMLGGCATSVPITAQFPAPPGKMAIERCPNLKKLNEKPALSDVSRTVAENYNLYYECVVKLDAWQEWYEVQKRIFENATK
jgi:hypothetical protein